MALRWHGVERGIAVALYAYRLVGFAAFELTGAREVLFIFPNVFELWFLVVAADPPLPAGLHVVAALARARCSAR